MKYHRYLYITFFLIIFLGLIWITFLFSTVTHIDLNNSNIINDKERFINQNQDTLPENTNNHGSLSTNSNITGNSLIFPSHSISPFTKPIGCEIPNIQYSTTQSQQYLLHNIGKCHSKSFSTLHYKNLLSPDSEVDISFNCSTNIRYLWPKHIKESGKLGVHLYSTLNPSIKTLSVNSNEITYLRCGDSRNYHVHVKRRKDLPLPNYPPLASSSSKPSFLIISYDSLSSGHFYRNFPQTRDLLTSLSSDPNPSHEVFHFKGHAILGDNTLPNMIPLIWGVSRENQARSNMNLHLFQYFARQGYVTYFDQDDCPPSINLEKNAFNRQSSSFIHHRYTDLWCAFSDLEKVAPFTEGPHCIGNVPASSIFFDFIYSFHTRYLKNARLSFAHMSDLHESTGSGVTLADFPLFNLLSRLLPLFSLVSSFSYYYRINNTFVIISSDHGMRYGAWRRTEAVRKNFQTNSVLLNNNFDWHLTLKHLSVYPDELPPNHYPKSPYAHSILTPLPISRNCQNSGIPVQFCPNAYTLAVDVIQTMNNEILASMYDKFHSSSQSVSLGPNTAICRNDWDLCCGILQLDKIYSLERIVIDQNNINYRIQFSTRSPYNDDFEGFINWKLNQHDINDNIEGTYEEQAFIPHHELIFENGCRRYSLIVHYIHRPSSWPMECRNKAVEHHVEPKFCFCPTPFSSPIKYSLDNTRIPHPPLPNKSPDCSNHPTNINFFVYGKPK